jgi:CHAT domain-containing protein
MTTFYRLRRAGSGKADALRAAQLALLQQLGGPSVAVARRSAVPVGRVTSAGAPAWPGRYAHPYFWAPFVLAGDGR